MLPLLLPLGVGLALYYLLKDERLDKNENFFNEGSDNRANPRSNKQSPGDQQPNRRGVEKPPVKQKPKVEPEKEGEKNHAGD